MQSWQQTGQLYDTYCKYGWKGLMSNMDLHFKIYNPTTWDFANSFLFGRRTMYCTVVTVDKPSIQSVWAEWFRHYRRYLLVSVSIWKVLRRESKVCFIIFNMRCKRIRASVEGPANVPAGNVVVAQKQQHQPTHSHTLPLTQHVLLPSTLKCSDVSCIVL